MQKTLTKKHSKRIVIDYTQNPDLESKVFSLENRFSGFTRAEITKLAIIELFQKEIVNNQANKTQIPQNLPIHYLTPEEETSLTKALKTTNSKTRLKNASDIKNFVKQLAS